MRSKNKRSSRKSSEPSSGGWMVTYSGFILIMLCFFIMLCSFSSVESSKITSFVKSFSLAVSIFDGGLNFEKADTLLPVSSDIVEVTSELAQVFDEIETIIEKSGIGKEVETFQVEGGIGIRFSDKVLFELGQADIHPDALPILDKIGKVLKKSGCLTRIDGHTDDLPIYTPVFPSNWELSATRAINVLRYFIDTQDISSSRLSAQGFGEYHPLVLNTTEKDRAKNRRVEIMVFKLQNATVEKEI